MAAGGTGLKSGLGRIEMAAEGDAGVAPTEEVAMRRWVFVVLVCGLVAVEAARADVEVGAGVGYSQIDLDGALDGSSALRLEPRVSVSLEGLPQ